MNVGLRIRELRENAGLTVNKLANMSGISQSHLREIELGNKNPTVETLSYFCEALGISLKQFFSDKEESISPQLLSSIERLDNKQQTKLAEFINCIKISDNANEKRDRTLNLKMFDLFLVISFYFGTQKRLVSQAG